jgi:hypothetical protein
MVNAADCSNELLGQVQNWEERFRKGLLEFTSTSIDAQTEAFGSHDGTGVEAVHDTMPTEAAVFEELSLAGAGRARDKREVCVLDFGCGDGRYLKLFLRIADHLSHECGCSLRVVAYDVSFEALRSFSYHAERAGLVRDDCGAVLSPMSGCRLRLEFVLGDVGLCAESVGCLLQQSVPVFDVTLLGWGTLSSIPRTPTIDQDRILSALAKISASLMNVVSNTTNHLKFQREYAARRQALRETSRPEVRQWLQQRLGLATFEGSYYYTVGTGQRMFYTAITAECELARLRAAGFVDPEVKICSIINFFTILTRPRAARLNAAVIRLLERNDSWGAQLLLSRGVALVRGCCLGDLRRSPIFDTSSSLTLRGQVARYFVSVCRASGAV